MSRPPAQGPAGPSRPLGKSQKSPTSAPQPGGSTSQVPRRSAGALPGLARAASSIRQGQHVHQERGQGQPLASLPAHLRNLSTPRVPSPLGKGTPAKGLKQTLPVRTSKTTERHVFLPEDPQLAPLPSSPMGSQTSLVPPPRPPPPSSSGSKFHTGHTGDERSDAEKMTKREREENRLPRLTAYATAEAYRLKLLQAFLKREHGVGVVRVFDDCVYAVYTLPLLPGYAASTKVRSSPSVRSPGGVSLLERMTLAEDMGYNDSYFPTNNEEAPNNENPSEYILSRSPPSPISPVSPLQQLVDLSTSPEDRRINDDMQPQQSEHVDADQPDREEAIEANREVLERQDGVEGALEIQTGPRVVEHHGHPGTHLSTSHPGQLEHVPAPSLSPSELEEAPPLVEHGHYRLSPPETKTDLPRIDEDQVLAHSPRIPQPIQLASRMKLRERRKSAVNLTGKVAEAVFFSYGVSVFFGFQEDEEKEIMEDVEGAGIWAKGLDESDWEVEEFHYLHEPEAEFPRIYNDMFTFKSNNHLFKLSLAHAIAQSTKLSIYEAIMSESLNLTSEFPKELSITGHLQLNRRDALKLTGRLFKLRMDVNLIGGILDTPELFWSEASLYPLYEAIREYLEIGPRAQVLNDRLSVAGDLLEIIHEYIEEKATDRITWIIIWLIVVACLVEVGEVVARLVFHAIPRDKGEFLLVKGTRAVLGGAIKPLSN